jgi:hypothetical protein
MVRKEKSVRDALVRVVDACGRRRAGARHELHAVMRLVLHPVGEEALGEPGAPLDLQHLLEIALVDHDDDPGECEQREHADLAEELGAVPVLQRVIKVVVPGVELHLHVDRHQREPDDRREQRQALRALLRHPVRLGKGPESL